MAKEKGQTNLSKVREARGYRRSNHKSCFKWDRWYIDCLPFRGF